MALNKNSQDKLNKQFKSYDSSLDLIKDVIKISNFNFKRVFRLIIVLLFSVIISVILSIHIKFSEVFNYISNINITISVGLLCLLIAGLPMLLSSFNKDSLYSLILEIDKDTKTSFFKKSLLIFIEPLLWLLLLLLVSYILKLIYFLYPILHFKSSFIFIIKILVLTTMISIGIFSIISLEFFIINVYNLLSANARFELLERHIKSKNYDINKIIENMENLCNTHFEEHTNNKQNNDANQN